MIYFSVCYTICALLIYIKGIYMSLESTSSQIPPNSPNLSSSYRAMKILSPIISIALGAFYYYSRQSLYGPLTFDRKIELALGAIGVSLMSDLILGKIGGIKQAINSRPAQSASIQTQSAPVPQILPTLSTPEPSQHLPQTVPVKDPTIAVVISPPPKNEENKTATNASKPIGAGGNRESRFSNINQNPIVDPTQRLNDGNIDYSALSDD